MNLDREPILTAGDLTPEFARLLLREGISAWDIETSGLDFRDSAIHTCQVSVPGVGTQVVKVSGTVPPLLTDLLESDRVRKVFHHAPFDLRFMRAHWDVRPRNVACTKVLSKIVNPRRENHSLEVLVRDYLGLELDKSQRLSDWSAVSLTSEQIAYATEDVAHLIELYRYMWKEALNEGLGDVVEQSFAYLPTRVETDLRGSGDVFSY